MKAMTTIAAAAFAVVAQAVGDNPATRRADTPDKRLTREEIVSAPRRATTKLVLPSDCGWILYSYFQDEGKVYVLNLDYARERKCVLQQFGDKDFITLKPGEFRIIGSVKLDTEEKLNVE